MYTRHKDVFVIGHGHLFQVQELININMLILVIFLWFTSELWAYA